MTPLLHPEATEDPQTLRWVTDVADLPDDIAADLIRDGTLAAIDVRPGEIRTRLASGHTWATSGPAVRTALFQALTSAQAAGPGEDLQQQITQIVTREVEPLVKSHGGMIRVVSVADNVVYVALDGTCGHCDLQNRTLNSFSANAIRARFPEIRAVRAVRG